MSIQWRRQLQQNAVAIISLAVAATALLYTTWRNEKSEWNWNVRVAGFEMLMSLGELQRIVYLNHYDGDAAEGSPRKGWVRVMVLRDLGLVMPDPLPERTDTLLEVWRANWPGIGNDQEAVARIEVAIDHTRDAVLDALGRLE
jgi:hypothetical protein